MYGLVRLTGILAILPVSALAQSSSNSDRPDSWYAGIATGEYFPTKDWPTTYRLGGGGELILGKQVAPQWSVQLSVNQWLQSGSRHTTWDFKTGPMVRWMGAGSHVRPFALAGVGIDVQADYPSRTSSGRTMLPLGAGIEVPTSRHASVFVESMYYVLLRSAATRDVPLLLGFRAGF